MLTALALSVALNAAAVPPGSAVVNHASPGHYAQPTVQIFERKQVDDYRRANWLRYNADLDAHWRAYRATGSTPAAWQAYQVNAEAAKRRYLVDDPYLLPVVTPSPAYLPPWQQLIIDGALAAGSGCTQL
jgi:hypothetical protein